MNDASWEVLSLQLLTMAAVLYAVALGSHSWQWAGWLAEGRNGSETRRTAMSGRLGVVLTWMAAGLHLLALVSRGLAADPNRVPWSNMYEFTVSGTFALVAAYLGMRRGRELDWLAPLVVGLAVVLLTLARVSLYSETGPLIEALRSPWLVIHVFSAILATGIFTLAGMIAGLYLVKARKPEGWTARLPELADLDKLSFRLHAFGFPIWTFAVLISGPIWARNAWGSYWNWDAKEVWAFISWVVYAAYLHARSTAGWRGRRAALVALIGVATLWFNFVVINYFSTNTQHSYAHEVTTTKEVL